MPAGPRLFSAWHRTNSSTQCWILRARTCCTAAAIHCSTRRTIRWRKSWRYSHRPPPRNNSAAEDEILKHIMTTKAKSTDTNWDVIIIGSGPAGSSSSAILSEFGHKVLVLEREKFPRYHIGESLIPFTFQPLQRLGLVDLMKKSNFVKKYSVQFISRNGKVRQPFYFFTRYDPEQRPQTWQVLRSEFDQILLDNTRAKGTTVKEQVTVKELLREKGRVVGVRAQDKDGTITEYRAPITLDCTGKEAFTAVRNHWRVKDPYLNKVAVWTYYKGAKRDPGVDEGATTV